MRQLTMGANLQLEEAFSRHDFDYINRQGFSVKSGFGCDCPGGDDAIVVDFTPHSSGGDCGMWYWLVEKSDE